jgi:hypothetical protein
MLSAEADLHTFSRGKEPERYLVLSPVAEADIVETPAVEATLTES